MIIAEKLAQKLNNLKSKKEIKDFFIFYDEHRSLELNLEGSLVSNFEKPTTYIENSDGNFLIVWNDDHISFGVVNTDCVNEFDEFINLSRHTKIKSSSKAFIPEKGIYPMTISYSKTLADMIDLPEYLLKITDVSDELDRMIKADGTTSIKATEGIRYGYSSRELDEYYPYTEFLLEKSIGNEFYWKIKSADIFSLTKLEEIFSFFGDIYNMLNNSAENAKELEPSDLVLSPSIFERLFMDQIVSNINGQSILENKSCFKKEDFENKLKVYDTLSFSYDPLVNYKPGTYKFTSFGLKPQKAYFIKFGKLQTPLLNNINYNLLGYNSPTVEITNMANIKFEGIKKKTYTEYKRSRTNHVLGIKQDNYVKVNSTQSCVYFDNLLSIEEDDSSVLKNKALDINLMEYIQAGKLELIEFSDGQLGCKLNQFKF